MMPSSLLQVVNTLFQTCYNKLGTSSANTTCWQLVNRLVTICLQTCNNLCVFTRVPNLVPRLFLRGRKDPGRSWSRDAYKIDCQRGYGQSVKLHRLPLPDFTLPLQGVSVLYNRLWESHIFQNTCLIWFLFTFQLWLYVKQICIAADKSGNQEIKT